MRQVLRTDGTTVVLHLRYSFEDLKMLIGAEYVDMVRLHHMEPTHVMLVNDNGYVTTLVEKPRTSNGFTVELVPTRALLPVNDRATKLYWLNCVAGTTHQIVGDVVVVPDTDIE